MILHWQNSETTDKHAEKVVDGDKRYWMPEENGERRHNVRNEKTFVLISAKKYKESTKLVPLQAWCLCPPLRSLWENGDQRENWEQSKKKNVLRKPMGNLRVS